MRCAAAHRCGCAVTVGVDGLALDEDDDVLREMRLVQMMHGGLGFERTWTTSEFLALAIANGRKATGASGTATPDGETAAGAIPPASKIPRVATLVYGTRAAASATSAITGVSAITLFRERLRELGYVEGQTILVEERYADGDPQRLEALAKETVAGNPDVIVAIAAAATAATRRATSTIPIVMAHAGDPVGAGWVASLAQPGGNVTGSTSQVPDLGSKQVELLRELVPRLARLGACL